MYEALVARVRYHIQKANFMGLKDAESTLLLKEAADAIEELSRENESLARSVNEASDILRHRWIPGTETLNAVANIVNAPTVIEAEEDGT